MQDVGTCCYCEKVVTRDHIDFIWNIDQVVGCSLSPQVGTSGHKVIKEG